MRLPIQYALTWPDRAAASWPRLEPGDLSRLEFEPPDLDRFPCLGLGYRAAREGGAAPAVLNAANEVLVEAFLAGEITFPDIADGIEAVLDDHSPTHPRTVDDILEVDRAARRSAEQWLRAGASIPPTEGRPVGP
jgi:1-deoxy-D-xylulose-5-phosphate reductoisomerase